MSFLKALLLLSTTLLLSSCCSNGSSTCYSPGPIPRPCSPEPCCDYDDEDCCDDRGYCARPYLWEHY